MYYLDQTLHGIFLNWTALILHCVVTTLPSWFILDVSSLVTSWRWCDGGGGGRKTCLVSVSAPRGEDGGSSPETSETLPLVLRHHSGGSPQYRDDDDPVSAVFCCILILFANQKSDSPSWHVVYNLSLKLSEASASPTQLLQESSHAAVLQCCRSASVVFSACSTRNYRDQEFIFTHSTRVNWPSILERNTKIRIPHIPASLNLIYLWPNGIRAEM